MTAGTRINKRTIDRAKNAAGLVALRTGFRLAERVSPALGARWAERLWFTVPGATRRGARRHEPRETFEVPVNGSRVVVERWGAGPTVYLVHGWGGARGQFGTLVGPLVAAGHRVVAFDAPSHGESAPGPSGPRQTTLFEFADALAAVAAAAGGPAHGVVAHSGGCLATALALRAGLEVARVAFIAPMAELSSYVPVLSDRFGLGPRVRAGMVERAEHRVGVPLSALDVPAMAPELAGRSSLLLVHDRDDPETPWSGGKAIATAWPGARLVTTTGLGHRRIVRDPNVVAEIVAFM